MSLQTFQIAKVRSRIPDARRDGPTAVQLINEGLQWAAEHHVHELLPDLVRDSSKVGKRSAGDGLSNRDRDLLLEVGFCLHVLGDSQELLQHVFETLDVPHAFTLKTTGEMIVQRIEPEPEPEVIAAPETPVTPVRARRKRKERKTATVIFRVPQAERDELEEHASRAGLSISDYARTPLTDGLWHSREPEERDHPAAWSKPSRESTLHQFRDALGRFTAR